MKKTFIILIIIFAICLNASIIEKTYHFGNYKISEIEGFQTIEFEDAQQQAKTGEPVLPYISVSLILPPGEIAESIEVIGSNEKQIPGTYLLYPKQQVRPVSMPSSSEFIKDNTLYNSSEVYPQNQSGELITQFLHGYSIALNTFTPVMYVPADGKISYYDEVKIIIHTRPDMKAQIALNNLLSNETVINRVNKISQNSEMISQYSTVQSREGEYQLLIITPAQFEFDFDEMREVYLQQGMISEVKTVEEIYSSMPGQDQPEKIRNYIIQEYQEHEIEYVLLAGDVEHVPYRGFYCTVNSGGGYEDSNIPSDLYYSALDGNWNDDGDNNWGEIGEDDLLPEVAVARFSFTSTTDLENMLNKTILYQTQPVTGELRDPLMAGEHLYNNPITWGADYLDLLIGYHDDNGYETTGIPEDHNISTIYDRDMGSWTATQLLAEINEGHSFIHHVGHANYEYAMRLSNPDITNANFNMINGVDHNYTFVYTHGCNCGSFDHNDGIGERMINIENFLAAFVGNSRYGWFNEGQTEGPSAHLHREFVDALYTDKYHRIGRAHMESKTATAPWVTAPGQWEEGAIRWCFYDCNVLGGSALPIWTDEPLVLEASFSSVIFLGVNTFDVGILNNGIPIEGMQCTIIQNGELIGTAVTDLAGNAEIPTDPDYIVAGEAELYISGFNRPTQMHQLQVIPPGYYVNIESYSITSGNDNILEFGENALLSMNLEAIGIGAVNDVLVTISTEDDYVTINDSTEFVTYIALGDIVEINDAFDFYISNDVPNDHSIDIHVLITCDEGGWQSGLNFTAYAAELELNSVEVIDGDNNALDAGETAELAVEIHNLGGADLYNLISSITSANPDVVITNLPNLLDSLNADGTENIVICSVEVSENAQSGDIIAFDLEIIADNEFSFSESFTLVVEEEVATEEGLIPNVTKLIGNYPNPFNPETTISFSLNTENTEYTEINIYTIKGQKVKTLPIYQLTNSQVNHVTWNGTDENDQPVASGIYFYQLNIDDKIIASKKCLLLK